MSRQEEARQTIQAFKDAAEKRIDELEQVCRQAVTAFQDEVSADDPTIAALKAAVQRQQI